jgi:DNA-binding response OmpR family regulator
MSAPAKNVIVYVEDNSGDSLLLREALIEASPTTELLVIDNGQKALHYFEVKARARDLPPPHCILLDDNLPMVTGIDLIKFIRSNDAFQCTPVFIFAAPSKYADVRAVVDISPDSFLRKPTDWDQFRLLADTLVQGAWLADHAPHALPEAAIAPPPPLRHDPVRE